MDSVLIPCPKCGKELKLRDRSLLGKTGKCPKCEFRFVLQEPDEVELELADEDVPVTGTSPKWVPDQAGVMTAPASTTPLIRTEEPVAVASSRMQATRQRRKQQWKLGAIVGGVSAVVVGGLLLLANTGEKRAASNNAGKSTAKTGDPSGDPIDDPLLAAGPNGLPAAPPKGEPIKLTAIPLGARVIIHLRPAELWKVGSNGETVRLCLGPLGIWAEKRLKELLLFEPAQIEEAVICLFLDDKTKPPELAFSVKLKAEQLPSTFIEKFGGKPEEVDGHKVYKTLPTGTKPALAYMITDRVGKGFAACPASMAGEMVKNRKPENPGLPGGGLEQLLNRTDDKRHFTILFEPGDLRGFQTQLFPETLHGVLGHFLDRFEENRIESVAWSLYFGSKQHPDFHSELLLRNKTDGSPLRLKNNMARKFDDLPGQLADLIGKMTPRIVAERKLVSRLPVMTEAFRVETVYTLGSENERFIKLTTALPDVAGPNLAAASMLTWRLASVTDFSKPKPKQPTGPKLPELVKDRLNLPVEIDFRKRPLQGAIDDIAEGISVKADIDGDALKNSAFTKNMEQNMKLGTVPAKKALYEIIKKYKGMCLVIDEPKKTILITTEKFLRKGQKPFPLGP